METSTSSRRPLSRWVKVACWQRETIGRWSTWWKGTPMWELLVEESIRREAATCSGELIVQLCATIFVQTGSQEYHLSGTRSLSMPLDTGFRRQQSTCLAVFSAGRIPSTSPFSTELSNHQPRMFLPVPSQGSDGRECDAHLHHCCQPAKALCPVRPGKHPVQPGCIDESSLLQCIRLNQGEDRWLCTLLLKQGWRVEYSAASDSFTACPEVDFSACPYKSVSVVVRQ